MKRSMSPGTGSAQVPFLIFVFSVSTCIDFGLCYGRINGGGCRQSEREALLEIKKDIEDPSGRLASWSVSSGDCCSWFGVICDNSTGHVLQLHLSTPFYSEAIIVSPSESDEEYRFSTPRIVEPPHRSSTDWYGKSFASSANNTEAVDWTGGSKFGGKINPSLLNLTHLRYLDLSYNEFESIQIPKFLGSMKSLIYLDLSNTRFEGPIPPQLGNLTNLRYLNLGYSIFYYTRSVVWLSTLSSLQFLDLSSAELSETWNLMEVITSLPSLQELHLSSCSLPPVPSGLNVNVSSLCVLDLSSSGLNQFSDFSWVSRFKDLKSLTLASNYIGGTLPREFQNLTSLRELDLSYNYFNASVPSNWLFDLRHLEILNLAGNDFSSSIPMWWYGFTNLQHLDLTYNKLRGKVSNSIGNITSLVSLDLSRNYELVGGIPASFRKLCNLRSLSFSDTRLSQEVTKVFENLLGCGSEVLEVLNLGNCNLSGDWDSKDLGRFKSLASLDLRENSISGAIPMSLVELNSLTSLDLSSNKMNGNLPLNIGELRQLKEFYMAHNSISGPIPTSLVELSFLKTIDLSGNKLNGSLPVGLGKLKNLQDMDISVNSISGPIPMSFGKLSNVEWVDISQNSMEGDVSEIHFTNLSKLESFRASGNRLKLRVGPRWIPPVGLSTLELGSWDVGPQFPSWIPLLLTLSSLDLSNSGISSSIPVWLSESSQFRSLNLSSNRITGLLPHISSQLDTIDLSNNLLVGTITNFLCHKIRYREMQALNLEKNLLFGELPDCWKSWPRLNSIKLSNNKFNGSIPKSIGALSALQYLHLRNNNLSGELPLSLKHCENLVTLDLGQNALAGSIPRWIGKNFSSLVVLNFRTNKFDGVIPEEVCQSSSLQILDFANNNLSGSIPGCFSNFSGMGSLNNLSSILPVTGNFSTRAIDSMLLQLKGEMSEYSTILGLVRIVDLSNNRLSGEIPQDMTRLAGLMSLNLSHNSLGGRIPKDIGGMRSIEVIDFSNNRLNGEIPPSISSLTFLSRLNLSCNKLVGRIPSSTQIQGLDSSSFIGNELCGKPLTNNCTGGGTVVIPSSKENGKGSGSHGYEIEWLYVTLAFGFIVGFWGVVGPLLFNRNWRNRYFRFLQRVEDKIYIWWHFM